MKPKLIFKNVNLIDGEADLPIKGMTVEVQDGIISAIWNTFDVSHDGQVIDLKGKVMMPGLMDIHVHAGNLEVRHDRTAVISPAVYVHRVTRILETDLALGFTTLRDATGLDHSFKEASLMGLIEIPRLLLSVTCLTVTGGHGDKRPWYSDDPLPRNSLGIFPLICNGPDQVAAAAREVLRKKADVVKLMADGGVASPSDWPGQWQFTVEEIKAAVQVAQAARKSVMAHVYGKQSAMNCIWGGVDSIEHGNLLDQDVFDLMAEKKISYVPTLSVFDILLEHGKDEGMSDFVLDKLKMVAEKGLAALAFAKHSGVLIGSGSDIIGPFQHLKGRELALKAQVMRPIDVIRAVTINNAKILGLEDEIGSLKVGKKADFIVLKSDPLEDMSLFEDGLANVLLVVKEGKIVKNLLEPSSTSLFE
jgi:imidazolonepropionase-like amidohydrolase